MELFYLSLVCNFFAIKLCVLHGIHNSIEVLIVNAYPNYILSSYTK